MRMATPQGNLFGNDARRHHVIDAAHAAMLRGRLDAMLALVEGANAMPWARLEDIIHADNGFRHTAGLLPPEEGAPLWARFDREMDRLYAIMNEGKKCRHCRGRVRQQPTSCRRLQS